MIGLALALAATGMQLAEPKGKAASWVNDTDYPRSALVKNIVGRTRFRIVVGTDGKPLNCTVVVSSGNADLDHQTCALMLNRANFSPATGNDGTPIAGTFSSVVAWMTPAAYSANRNLPKPSLSDLQLTVSALPKSLKEPATVRVGLLVELDGKIAGCKPSEIPENRKTVEKLGKIACQQAIALIKTTPMLDTQQHPILSVQDFEVSFSKAP